MFVYGSVGVVCEHVDGRVTPGLDPGAGHDDWECGADG